MYKEPSSPSKGGKYTGNLSLPATEGQDNGGAGCQEPGWTLVFIFLAPSKAILYVPTSLPHTVCPLSFELIFTHNFSISASHNLPWPFRTHDSTILNCKPFLDASFYLLNLLLTDFLHILQSTFKKQESDLPSPDQIPNSCPMAVLGDCIV